MNKLKFYLITITYITVVIFSIGYLCGAIRIGNTCDFYSNRVSFYLRMLSLITFIPLIGYIFSLLIKAPKENHLFFTAGVPILAGILTVALSFKFLSIELYKHKCIIQKAYVKDIYSSGNRQEVTVVLNIQMYKYTWVIPPKSFDARDLVEGDSLLVIYAEDCKALHEIYNPFPTHKEFIECEEGCILPLTKRSL